MHKALSINIYIDANMEIIPRNGPVISLAALSLLAEPRDTLMAKIFSFTSHIIASPLGVCVYERKVWRLGTEIRRYIQLM